MPRPPAELRHMKDEERRRDRAHRRLQWERRLRMGLWLLGALVILVVFVLFARLAGFSLG